MGLGQVFIKFGLSLFLDAIVKSIGLSFNNEGYSSIRLIEKLLIICIKYKREINLGSLWIITQ